MIKHELTIQELFNRWQEGAISAICFDSLIFELIDKANLTQIEQIRLGFPEHVAIFEDYYDQKTTLSR